MITHMMTETESLLCASLCQSPENGEEDPSLEGGHEAWTAELSILRDRVGISTTRFLPL